MSLPHALLTSLLEKPSSGAELSIRFDRSIGHFWQATHQQIYRELAKLEAAKWVESEVSEEHKRKKIYRVLPLGVAELKRWVAEPEGPHPTRIPMMVRLRAAAMVGTQALEPEIERHLALHQASLAHYLALKKRDKERSSGTSTEAIQLMILQSGIELERYWINTLKAALAELKAHPENL